MQNNDQQLGAPHAAFSGTKAQIEALPNPVAGWIAVATDTSQVGCYDGSAWVWGGGSGSGDMLKSTYDTDDDGIVDAAEEADTLDGLHAADFAPDEKGVTGGDSHAHTGGAGGQIDHGSQGGLGDDDHEIYLKADGTRPLSANWDAGDHKITAQQIESDVATGTPPLVVASTTEVANLNANRLNGYSGQAFLDYSAICVQNVFCARLGLESGVPVSSADQSAKSTLYLNPYKGDRIGLYYDDKWNVVALSSPISISLAGLTAGRPYDVFVYSNSGTLTLELAAWTNASTRATALATQNGVLVKSGSPTRRYAGTIYINSSGGQTDDSKTRRFVWNYYNRIWRPMFNGSSSAHTYNGAARKWNNSDANNLLEFVIGVSEEAQTFSFRGGHYGGADGSYATILFYMDGSEVNTLYRVGNMNAYSVVGGVALFNQPAIGYHSCQVYETGNHASSTFSNMCLMASILG